MPKTAHLEISGHVENNTIILDESITLPDGIKVTVIIADDTVRESSGLCGIWKDGRPVEAIINDVIGSRSASRDLPPIGEFRNGTIMHFPVHTPGLGPWLYSNTS